MATIEGAKTLGLETQIGSLEQGKCADVVILKINSLATIPFENIYSKIVYSTNKGSVKDVMINGRWIVRDQTLLSYDEKNISEEVYRNFGKHYFI